MRSYFEIINIRKAARFLIGANWAIGMVLVNLVPVSAYSQDGIKIDHMVSSNNPNAILLPPPKTTPLGACPLFPGKDSASTHVLAPAYDNFPIELEFRGPPKTEVHASVPRSAPGYLTYDPNQFRVEKTVQGWTDEQGVYKFFFVVSKQNQPLNKPIEFAVSASAEGSMDGQSALVTVGLGLEIDPKRSRLIPVSYSSDITQSAAWFISPRSRFHPALDIRQYFENVLNCKEQKMGLPLVIVDALWNEVSSTTAGFSYLEPAPPALHGDRFMRSANGVGAIFGSTFLPRFDFQTLGNHTTRWVKGTTVVKSRDIWNKVSRDAWDHPEEASFEPSFFPPGFFLVAPFEEIESVQESAACALEARNNGQSFVLAALEMVPKFGQVPSVIGHLMKSLCQFARGDDTQALQTLFNGGLKEGAEWLVFEHFVPDKLRAWNNQQLPEVKMNEAQIQATCSRIQAAFKGELAINEVGKSEVSKEVRDAAEQRLAPQPSSFTSTGASAANTSDSGAGLLPVVQPPPTGSKEETIQPDPIPPPNAPQRPGQKATRLDMKASALRTQELQKELERATKEGRNTGDILDRMIKELDNFQQMYESDK